MEPDFSGWATKANLKCSDGRTIMPDAFKHMDGQRVPLVYQHGHNTIDNVLGYAVLKHMTEGVRADAFFNKTPNGQNAKMQVEHGDLKHLSIYANNLQERNPGKQVTHGNIREVSLVLAGANPGAVIDHVNIKHSDGSYDELDDEAIIHTGEELFHADPNAAPPAPSTDNAPGGTSDASGGKTVQDVWESLTPDQQDVVNYIVNAAVENALEGGDPDGDGDNDATAEGVVDDAKQDGNAAHTDNKPGEGDLSHQKGADKTMSRNVFDQSDAQDPKTQGKHVMAHSEVEAFFKSAQKLGSFDAALQGYALQHGIEPIDVLFPNYRNLDQQPQFLSRRMEWVDGVLSKTSKTPFARVRSIVADITMDEARALGYIKGNYKKEEWFSVSRRTTDPATVYKKQKLDRDDIIDITDFDVVSWMKSEMMVMLKEEIARAILIGDGRAVDDPDHIADPMAAASGAGLRSIINEHELYMTNVNVNIGDANSSYLEVAESILRAFRYYKGTGTPTFYTTLPVLTSLLLVKDAMGRRYWNNKAELASYLGVDDIVAVEAMETMPTLFGIIVNLADYNIGANKGGEISNFDFFDIDYNQYKYLAETRVSGALTRPKAALTIWSVPSADVQVTPVKPTFVKSTGVVTIPTTTGVTYYNADTNAALTAGAQTALTNGQALNVRAVANSGYFIEETGTLATVWSFMMPGVPTGDTD